MKQIILKDGRAVCVTAAPYDRQTLRGMKAAGCKIKEV